jgi:aerobic carbon-monoxide dehydrogenase large subunit
LRERQTQARAAGRHLGIGVGFELTPEGGDFAGSFVRGFDTSTVRVHPTGAVTVLTGVTSPGTGNETSIAQLVAAELGLPVDAVGVVQGDTDSCPYGFGNFSSRSLATGGAAAVLAAREIRTRMGQAAGVLLESTDEFVFVDGSVRSTTDPTVTLPFAQVAETIFRRGLAVPGLDQPLLEVTRIDQPHNFHHVPDEHGRFSAYPSFPYSAHVAVVEVDVETGVVTVEDFAAVDDCGVVVSPRFVAGQLCGAIAQGIGGALWEDLPYDDATGQTVPETFKHYLTPRAPDVPMIRLGNQQTPSPFTLLGTKGAGESGVGGAMAAVTNAVNDALAPLGVTAHTLPLNPPNVLAAILEGDSR